MAGDANSDRAARRPGRRTLVGRKYESAASPMAVRKTRMGIKRQPNRLPDRSRGGS